MLFVTSIIIKMVFKVVRYVSWNEFLYQMLAKGEVEEIIVRPDIEIVTIILSEGAIIKGKKVKFLKNMIIIIVRLI
jgi:hypothetical protein